MLKGVELMLGWAQLTGIHRFFSLAVFVVLLAGVFLLSFMPGSSWDKLSMSGAYLTTLAILLDPATFNNMRHFLNFQQKPRVCKILMFVGGGVFVLGAVAKRLVG